MMKPTIDVKKVVQALGYRVHSEATEDGKNRWWWTQTRDGQAGIECSPDYYDAEDKAWSAAEDDARTEDGHELFEPYFVTRIVVEVISEAPGIGELSLPEIADEIETGDSSGRIVSTETFILNAAEAAFVLQTQGSSPSFMGLDAVAITPWSPPEVPAGLVQNARELAHQILDARASGDFGSADWALAACVAGNPAE